MSNMEAQSMDTQVFLILQTSYTLFHSNMAEHPGCYMCQVFLTDEEIGFFLGIGGSILTTSEASTGGGSEIATEIRTRHLPNPKLKKSISSSGTSNAVSVASGRVSFCLGLTGPCVSLDTACSSSLVALHLAVSSLKLANCSKAATLGILVLAASLTFIFAAAGMLSQIGRCRTFDGRADGYCRGEGCCSFFFDMQKEEDPWHQIVSGSAVQQDGSSASLTAPNGSSQRRLLVAVSE
ncbi:polyketide synthase [bacterium]|nr:polyketide synthase [bacterium]